MVAAAIVVLVATGCSSTARLAAARHGTSQDDHEELRQELGFPTSSAHGPVRLFERCLGPGVFSLSQVARRRADGTWQVSDVTPLAKAEKTWSLSAKGSRRLTALVEGPLRRYTPPRPVTCADPCYVDVEINWGGTKLEAHEQCDLSPPIAALSELLNPEDEERASP